jgi:hypothetical protein
MTGGKHFGGLEPQIMPRIEVFAFRIPQTRNQPTFHNINYGTYIEICKLLLYNIAGLMVLEFLSPLWFIFVGASVFLAAFFGLIIGKKSEFTQSTVILILFFLPFAVHFIWPVVEDGDYSLEELVGRFIPDNFCSLSVVIAPFIYIFGNKFFKAGMVWFGLISGIIEVIYPACIGSVFSLDMVRFIFVHLFLALPPMLMLLTGLYKPAVADILRAAFYIIFCLSVIMLMQYIGVEMGLLDRGTDFLHTSLPNEAEQYGPENAMWDMMNIRGFVDWLVPDFFQTVQFGDYAGQPKWTPVLWAVIPAFVVCLIVGSAIAALLKIGKLIVGKRQV